VLRERLCYLRRQLREETDPDQRWRIKRSIADLTPVLTQMNELAELTEHYYDKEFYRDKKYTL
jgi:hypothetical protein